MWIYFVKQFQICKEILKKQTIYDYLAWFIIVVVFLSLRYWFSSTKLCFYTDQSRDAIIAQKILGGHLQLFGPVVNSRGALFHGVLYYYVIAPLYLLGSGNPHFVSISLSLLSIFSLIPTYLLAKYFLRSKALSYLVLIMLATSMSSVHTSASFWNLQLSIVFLPTFLFTLVKALHSKKSLHFLVMGASLGLLIQSGFSNIQWLFSFLLFLVIYVKKNGFSVKSLKLILISITGLLTTTSSMILVEILAWRRGLFAMEDSLHWIPREFVSIQSIEKLIRWYFRSVVSLTTPSAPIFAYLIICFLIICFLINNKCTKLRLLLMLLFSPIAGFLLSDGAASYTLTGYESIYYVFLVFVIGKVLVMLRSKNAPCLSLRRLIGAALLVSFSVLNILSLRDSMITNDSLACVWKTTNFDELAVIDFTYQKAAGSPFSIDVAVEPYGINQKYGYLYSWYGKQKYGYTPFFSGVNQSGHISEGLLEESDQPLSKHFVIYEPGSYNYWLKRREKGRATTRESQELFYYRQPNIDLLHNSVKIGELIHVDYYLGE